MPAVQVQRQCGVDRPAPLELAGDSEQQSLPSILDPVAVLDRWRNDLHQVRERHALLEQFPAFVQPLKDLDLRASLKGPAVQVVPIFSYLKIFRSTVTKSDHPCR
jgi:hypothetical protein